MHLLFPLAFRDRRSIPLATWRRLAGAFAVVCGAAFATLTAILVVHIHRGPSDIDSEEIEILHVTGHGFVFRFGEAVSLLSSPAVVAFVGLAIAAFLLWRHRALDALLV